MKKVLSLYTVIALLSLLFVILAISSLLMIKLTDTQIGVVQGEKFSFLMKSKFSNHGLEMNAIFRSLDLSDIMKNNNTVTQYEIGSVNQASHSFNITDENGVTYSVNTLTYGNIVFYQSNLNKNDKLYSGEIAGLNEHDASIHDYAKVIVNDSQTISYPSGQRTINHANYTLGTGYFNTQVNRTIYEDIYFDRSTGVATHVERVEVLTDNQNPSQYSILDSTWDLTQSSVWTVGTSTQNSTSNPINSPTPSAPEFSWLMILPLFIFILLIAVIVRLRKIWRITQH